jgi:D-alanyl-D-alanine dipeptidase
VDLTLYDLASGRAVRMPSGYDEFTDRAYAAYPGGTATERARRELLRRAMEAVGFAVNPTEWWHFDYNGWREFPVLNTPFERVP